jgi:hypothetical protein
MLRDITASTRFNPSIHQQEGEQKTNKAGFRKVTFDTRGINPFPARAFARRPDKKQWLRSGNKTSGGRL